MRIAFGFASLASGVIDMSLERHLGGDGPDTFYTLDTGWITRNARQLRECFPGKVLYAVKANPLPQVLQALSAAGVTDFDVASLGEVELLSRTLPTSAQYFMNPVKSRAAIDVAYRDHRVRTFVVDSEAELRKMRDVLPSSDEDITVYVRYAPSESAAVFDLRGKFGAPIDDAIGIADAAESSTRWQLGLAFHVGSQATEPAPFLSALNDAEHIIRRMASSVRALDVGGGLPGRYLNSSGDGAALLTSVAERVDASPLLRPLDLMCELGRGLVNGGMSLFARVLLVRGSDLFCAAGIFGGLLSAQQWLQYPVQIWRRGALYESDDCAPFQLFGPTCDSMDRFAFPYRLPTDVREGDWIEFQSVGAYSVSLRAPFNGFYTEDIVDVGR